MLNGRTRKEGREKKEGKGRKGKWDGQEKEDNGERREGFMLRDKNCRSNAKLTNFWILGAPVRYIFVSSCVLPRQISAWSVYIVAPVREKPPKTAIMTKRWISGFLSCTHLPIMAKFGVQVFTNDIFFFVEFRIDRYILSPMWSEKRTKSLRCLTKFSNSESCCTHLLSPIRAKFGMR